MQSIKNIIMNKIAVSVGKWEEKKVKLWKNGRNKKFVKECITYEIWLHSLENIKHISWSVTQIYNNR